MIFSFFIDLIMIIFNHEKYTLKYKIENQLLEVKSHYKFLVSFDSYYAEGLKRIYCGFQEEKK